MIANNIKGYLFTTDFCPRCPKAKDKIKKYPEIKIIDAIADKELSEKYAIMSVPTLIILKENNEFTRMSFSEIINTL